jgi:flagellar export protein FliJ
MYRFRLEALLNHRRYQEEVCQKELAQAQRELSDERLKLNWKKNLKQESVEKLQTKKKENPIVSDIMLHINYLTQLSKDIENQALRVQKSTQLVNQKRHELITIMTKRKTLKKIKYKDWQAYQQKLMQDERKLMDEVASTRHVRKM